MYVLCVLSIKYLVYFRLFESAGAQWHHPKLSWKALQCGQIYHLGVVASMHTHTHTQSLCHIAISISMLKGGDSRFLGWELCRRKAMHSEPHMQIMQMKMIHNIMKACMFTLSYSCNEYSTHISLVPRHWLCLQQAVLSWMNSVLCCLSLLTMKSCFPEIQRQMKKRNQTQHK